MIQCSSLFTYHGSFLLAVTTANNTKSNLILFLDPLLDDAVHHEDAPEVDLLLDDEDIAGPVPALQDEHSEPIIGLEFIEGKIVVIVGNIVRLQDRHVYERQRLGGKSFKDKCVVEGLIYK